MAVPKVGAAAEALQLPLCAAGEYQMKIAVTSEHIRMGCRRVGKRCPIALALRDATGHRWDVIEDRAAQMGMNGGWTRCIYLPSTAKQFVYDFDRGQAVDPFEFDIPFGNVGHVAPQVNDGGASFGAER